MILNANPLRVQFLTGLDRILDYIYILETKTSEEIIGSDVF